MFSDGSTFPPRLSKNLPLEYYLAFDLILEVLARFNQRFPKGVERADGSKSKLGGRHERSAIGDERRCEALQEQG
jgi:hypothetical protein